MKRNDAAVDSKVLEALQTILGKNEFGRLKRAVLNAGGGDSPAEMRSYVKDTLASLIEQDLDDLEKAEELKRDWETWGKTETPWMPAQLRADIETLCRAEDNRSPIGAIVNILGAVVRESMQKGLALPTKVYVEY
jgi:hypothetical protein